MGRTLDALISSRSRGPPLLSLSLVFYLHPPELRVLRKRSCEEENSPIAAVLLSGRREPEQSVPLLSTPCWPLSLYTWVSPYTHLLCVRISAPLFAWTKFIIVCPSGGFSLLKITRRGPKVFF